MGTERKAYPTTTTNSSGNLTCSPEVRESEKQSWQIDLGSAWQRDENNELQHLVMCFQGISSNDKTQGTHLILEGRILRVSPGSTGKAGNRPTLINYLEKADIQVGEQETALPFTSAAPSPILFLPPACLGQESPCWPALWLLSFLLHLQWLSFILHLILLLLTVVAGISTPLSKVKDYISSVWGPHSPSLRAYPL